MYDRVLDVKEIRPRLVAIPFIRLINNQSTTYYPHFNAIFAYLFFLLVDFYFKCSVCMFVCLTKRKFFEKVHTVFRV